MLRTFQLSTVGQSYLTQSLFYNQVLNISCNLLNMVAVVQFLSCIWLLAAPWTAACQAPLTPTISWSLFKLMFIESVMLSNHFILCHPFLLPLVFSSIRVFSNKSALHIRWAKYWNFSFSISPSNEYSGLISFRMDWFDLLAVQGTLKSLLQHHSSKASILCHSVFFMVQLSHLSMTTGKTIPAHFQRRKRAPGGHGMAKSPMAGLGEQDQAYPTSPG